MSSQDIQIVHFIPGRVRLKVAALKGNPGLARQIEREFGTVNGIHRLQANPLTGSVLICYDPDTVVQTDMMQTALANFGPLLGEELNLIVPGNPAHHNPGDHNGTGASALTKGTATFFGSVDTEVKGLTHGTIDLRALVPLTLFTLGIGSLLRAKQVVYPNWYEYLWFAFATFTSLYHSSPSRS